MRLEPLHPWPARRPDKSLDCRFPHPGSGLPLARSFCAPSLSEPASDGSQTSSPYPDPEASHLTPCERRLHKGHSQVSWLSSGNTAWTSFFLAWVGIRYKFSRNTERGKRPVLRHPVDRQKRLKRFS